MKDFTRAQAERWVEQELAKVTRENFQSRLASERRMIEFTAPPPFPPMPNSKWAHEELARRITEKFA